MLYRLFKFLLLLTTKAYFRSIYIQNKELVPKKGPVLFVANHTSAFMDPILLAIHIKRPLYFLARGDVFKNNFVSALFNKLHMIPIYKADVSPNEMHKNKKVFEKCYSHLENGKTVMIFPEGVSKTERRLRKFKTGVSRIAFGAEEKNNYELGLTIVPIGINYSNPHHFKSDVFVKFGAPIPVSKFKENYQNNPKEAVVSFTERIKNRLEKLVVVIENERFEKIIKQIEILYRSKLRENNRQQEKAPLDFYLSKDIVKAIAYFAKKSPEKLNQFEKNITQYLNNLKRLKIRDTQVRNSKNSKDLTLIFLHFIAGFPLFIYGYFFNFIPFKIAEFLTKKIQVRKDFIGSMKLGIGMLIFLITYIVQASLLALYLNWIWAFICLLSFYPSGLFTANYIKKYFQVRGILRYLYLSTKKSEMINQIKATRLELVTELEENKTAYLHQLKKEN